MQKESTYLCPHIPIIFLLCSWGFPVLFAVSASIPLSGAARLKHTEACVSLSSIQKDVCYVISIYSSTATRAHANALSAMLWYSSTIIGLVA